MQLVVDRAGRQIKQHIVSYSALFRAVVSGCGLDIHEICYSSVIACWQGTHYVAITQGGAAPKWIELGQLYLYRHQQSLFPLSSFLRFALQAAWAGLQCAALPFPRGRFPFPWGDNSSGVRGYVMLVLLLRFIFA